MFKKYNGFNPYFIGLPILIMFYKHHYKKEKESFNPYFIGLPILIAAREISLQERKFNGFNPYFIGLPILIRSVEKALYLLLLQNFFQTLKSSFFRFF